MVHHFQSICKNISCNKLQQNVVLICSIYFTFVHKIRKSAHFNKQGFLILDWQTRNSSKSKETSFQLIFTLKINFMRFDKNDCSMLSFRNSVLQIIVVLFLLAIVNTIYLYHSECLVKVFCRTCEKKIPNGKHESLQNPKALYRYLS